MTQQLQQTLGVRLYQGLFHRHQANNVLKPSNLGAHLCMNSLIFFHGCDASRCGAWLIALHQRLAQVKLKWPLFLKSFLLGAGRGAL